MSKFENQADLSRWAEQIEERVDSLSKSDWNARFAESISKKPGEEFYAMAGSWLKMAIKQGHPEPAVRNRMTKIDERLVEKWIEKSKLGTPLYSDTTTGSYAVPVQFFNEVARVAQEASVTVGKVTRVNMNSNTCSIPVESTGTSVKWVSAQTSAHSEISPTFSQSTLSCKTVGGYIGLSIPMLEDNDVAAVQHFFNTWGEDYGQEIDKQVLSANADPFTGVLRQGSAQIHTMSAGQTAYTDMTSSDVDSMIGKLTSAKYRRGAELFMNTLTYDVLRNLKTAEGDYLVAPWAMNPYVYKGFAVNLSDQISTPAVSTPFVGFFNPKHVFMGVRKDLELKVFDQTSYAATEDEVILRARARLAFVYPLTSAYAVMKTAAA